MEDFLAEFPDDPMGAFSHLQPIAVFGLFFAITLSIIVCCLGCIVLTARRRRSDAASADESPRGNETNVVWTIKSERESNEATNQIFGDAAAVAPVNVPAFPAYGNGDPVEYFSATHSKWLAADVTARLAAGDNNSKPEVYYATTIKSTSQQRMGIPLDLFREPLVAGEPCEAFVASQNKWVLAEIGPGRKTSGMHIMYAAKMLEDSSSKCQEIPASVIRRRFDAGTTVEVYSGIMRGWISAEVAPGKQANLNEDNSRSIPARLYWKQVPIVLPDKSTQIVPSYLLRPVGRPKPPPLQKEHAALSRDQGTNEGMTGVDPYAAQVGSGKNLLGQTTLLEDKASRD